jgi:hypothetical protein
MNYKHEVIIIGDGPAGISFFNRLKIHRKDAVIITSSSYQQQDDIYSRFSIIDGSSPSSWKFINSSNHEILKRKIPNYSDINKNFTSVEYFGTGGLSNRWGAGCAKLNAKDIGVNELLFKQISNYYYDAEQQVGIYYEGNDLLDDYLGKFKESNINLSSPESINFSIRENQWARIGRTRQALLQTEKDERKSCNNCGGCFIHCQNKTIYNARYLLQASSQEIYTSSRVVELSQIHGGYSLKLINDQGEFSYITAKIVILAAGTINSTSLLSTLIKQPVFSQFHHSIIARAVFFGFRQEKKNNFPMGQYIAQIKINDTQNAYASIVHGTSIPTSDIVDLLPFKNNFIYDLVNFFKKYLVVTMIFYSSEYSNYKIQLSSGRFVFVDTKLSQKFKSTHQSVLRRLKSILKLNYLYSIPFLTSILPQGSDIHYGGTIPIGLSEYINCTEECEIRGFPNLYVVDGSWMPLIPEKPHTFTIIANSMRVADHVASRLAK